MQALLPAARLTATGFRERYCIIDGYKKCTGAKNQEELNKLLTATIMIRRRKNEVLKQLPAKRRQQVGCGVDAACVLSS